MTNSNDVAKWLNELDTVLEAQPARVLLESSKKSVLASGAIYEVKNSDNLSLYLLTDYESWPNVIRHKTIFQDQDEDYWYVAGWIPAKSLTEENAEFHPFGVNVILSRTNEDFAQMLISEGTKVLKMDLQL